MKRRFLFFAAMLSAMLLLISTAYAAEEKIPVNSIYFSVMYDTETPQMGNIYVGHYFDWAELKDISIDKEKKLMSIELSLEGTDYKWAPQDIKVLRFKNAKNLKYRTYNTVDNGASIMLYLTWGDSDYTFDWFWKPDENGIKYVNPVTNASLYSNGSITLHEKDGDIRYYFDGGGNLYKTDKKSQWLKAGPYDIYCDKDGNLMKNTRTPDGYNVDKRGIWIQ